LFPAAAIPVVLPYLKCGYITSDAGDRWIACRRYYPDIKDQVGNILFSVFGKRAPQGEGNTYRIGPLLVKPNERMVDFLIRSRQLQVEWRTEATPTFWRLGDVPLEMLANKERR
jgi:hypothetical protein